MPADTSVKLFHSAQPGAPVIGNSPGSLIAMLDACLVNGWGLTRCDSVTVAGGIGTATLSAGHPAIEDCVLRFAGVTGPLAALNGERKVRAIGSGRIDFDADGIPDGSAAGTITLQLAPAGWEKAWAGTDKAAYRSADPASTRSFLRLDDSHAEYARPRGYLAMTDIDTGSDTFGGDTYWHRCWGGGGGRRWWLVANASMIYFGIQPGVLERDEGYLICAFGDGIARRSGDAYRCLLAGAYGASMSWAYPYMSALIYQNSAGFSLARSYTQLGGEVHAKPMGAYQDNVRSGSMATIPFPNGGDNSILLCQAEYAEIRTNCLRGRLPGLYFCPQYPEGALQNDFRIVNAADFPGKTLLWKLTGSSSPGYGGCAIDVSGPWE